MSCILRGFVRLCGDRFSRADFHCLLNTIRAFPQSFPRSITISIIETPPLLWIFPPFRSSALRFMLRDNARFMSHFGPLYEHVRSNQRSDVSSETLRSSHEFRTSTMPHRSRKHPHHHSSSPRDSHATHHHSSGAMHKIDPTSPYALHPHTTTLHNPLCPPLHPTQVTTAPVKSARRPTMSGAASKTGPATTVAPPPSHPCPLSQVFRAMRTTEDVTTVFQAIDSLWEAVCDHYREQGSDCGVTGWAVECARAAVCQRRSMDTSTEKKNGAIKAAMEFLLRHDMSDSLNVLPDFVTATNEEMCALWESIDDNSGSGAFAARRARVCDAYGAGVDDDHD